MLTSAHRTPATPFASSSKAPSENGLLRHRSAFWVRVNNLRRTAPRTAFFVRVERVVFKLIVEANSMHLLEDLGVVFSLDHHWTPAALTDIFGCHSPMLSPI
jgi:hypothetical protein